MEVPSSTEQIESILAVIDEGLIEFCNTMARRLITRSCWDDLPSSLRDDLERKSFDQLRLYEWMVEEEDDEKVEAIQESNLANIGRATRRLSIPKRPPHEALNRYPLCAGAKVGMTPKKVHECELFPDVVERVCVGCDVCLDVGTGQGYLALVCSQLFGLNVIGLEGGEDGQLLSRIRFQQRVKLLQAQPCFRGDEKHIPSFKQVVIEDSTTVETFRSEAGLSPELKIGLAGLHCCGQLSVNVLRLFASDPYCSSLALVGCCYGRLGSLGHAMSFPISEFCKKNAKMRSLGIGALRMASESVFLRRQESAECFDRAMHLLLFRLLSEEILERELGRDQYRSRKKVSHSATDFVVYFRALCRGLEAAKQVEISDEQLRVELEQLNTSVMRHRVAAMLALKSSLSSLIESLVVLDRVVWLEEQLGSFCRVEVFPCFDPSISPTNIVICARKK